MGGWGVHASCFGSRRRRSVTFSTIMEGIVFDTLYHLADISWGDFFACVLKNVFFKDMCIRHINFTRTEEQGALVRISALDKRGGLKFWP